MEFIDQDFRKARFCGANLEGSIFRGCDLRAANLKGAAYDGLVLTGSVANKDGYKTRAEREVGDEWAKKVLAEQRKIYQERNKE